MAGEDSFLEEDYEDRNGDPHGIGSPEWEEDFGYEEEAYLEYLSRNRE